jgi:cyanophycin synthetase
MNKIEIGSLHSNQRFFVEELLQRNIHVEVLVKELELLEATYNDHTELIMDRDGSVMPYASTVVCSDKYLTKKFLQRAFLNVPRGEQFFIDQKNEALLYAQKIGFPVVAKPSIGSHGEHCHLDVNSLAELGSIFDSVALHKGKNAAILVEEQRPGMELRVLITRNGDYAVVHRDPAHVIGDGVSTIKELAERESVRRFSPRVNCLCPIVIDDVVRQFLLSAGLSLESIPRKGAKIYLRRNSNVAQGGTCEDYTDRVHGTLIDVALRALRSIPHLPYAGIDILCSKPEIAQTDKSYSILEINSNPGLHLHVRPSTGKGRNVAAFIVDQLFPETVKRR